MKKISFFLFITLLVFSCKKDTKELLVKTWKYDTDQMYKNTSEYLKDHPIRDTILKTYKNVYLEKYRNSNYKFELSGALHWNDNGVKRTGTWAFADHDSTIVTTVDSLKIEYHILEITPEKMIWDDHVNNTDPKFKLSKPILVPQK